MTIERKCNRQAKTDKPIRNKTKKVKSDLAANNSRPPLQPLNQKQAEYIEAVKSSPITICTGVWGSSKTYIPSIIAADLLVSKKIEKIVIARPTEGKGKSVGFGKGSFDEKMTPWCLPIIDNLKQRMGIGHYEAMVENGRIELLVLEQVKGRSWDDAFILIDEAEDLEPTVAKSLVGRQGTNTTTVITGDINQQDLKSHSGLQLLLKVSEEFEVPVSLVDFNDWKYCVRSEEAKAWGMAFEKYENKYGKIK
ncbi:PhoH-like phosphate starvation-inducible [Alteromonas phage vB_AmeM_PT11-V22]|uniref:PhoH-like protein n=1 Tax=Alteromonas phage vB_AmeM_PT11-V22 TaxID=2704031 RepID=A0A6C0R0R6_9CAUD|nr:PhoH-like phosphate starvation-inducible [Alteromonas phage vB_AmeM_PT11-V22]QHZ59875.1 PhoH-like protein [Alteromonas phage vB_AmeM_PT11-V22]